MIFLYFLFNLFNFNMVKYFKSVVKRQTGKKNESKHKHKHEHKPKKSSESKHKKKLLINELKRLQEESSSNESSSSSSSYSSDNDDDSSYTESPLNEDVLNNDNIKEKSNDLIGDNLRLDIMKRDYADICTQIHSISKSINCSTQDKKKVSKLVYYYIKYFLYSCCIKKKPIFDWLEEFKDKIHIY